MHIFGCNHPRQGDYYNGDADERELSKRVVERHLSMVNIHLYVAISTCIVMNESVWIICYL